MVERGAHEDPQFLRAKGAQRLVGVTREEVCHYVTLVKWLPADLVVAVAAEQDPRVGRRLSLTALLGIARLDDIGRQRAAFEKLVCGSPRSAAA